MCGPTLSGMGRSTTERTDQDFEVKRAMQCKTELGGPHIQGQGQAAVQMVSSKSV